MINSEPYKVSILVPVYGVEKYIERCARSHDSVSSSPMPSARWHIGYRLKAEISKCTSTRFRGLGIRHLY